MVFLKNIFKKIIIITIKKFSLEERLASLNKLVNYNINNSEDHEKIIDSFTDTLGRSYKLIEGLRDQIKPGWEEMLIEKDYEAIPSDGDILDQLDSSKKQIKELIRLMGLHSVKINPEMDILEVGAFNGATTYQIASKNPKSIVGSDYVQYQNNTAVTSKDLKSMKELGKIQTSKVRNKIGSFFDKKIKNIVSFINDDICNSKIDSNSKDLILSWETLEHLNNPKKAFQEMFRILKPGGYTFHQYNPFFSFNGGHSLCTLDFMWGHVRLSSKDFKKYLIQFRPNEHDIAFKFYKKNLNRMTLNELDICIKDSGFEHIMFFPHVYFENYFALTEKIYTDCKRNYPSIELVDLVCPSIFIGLKKPIL